MRSRVLLIDPKYPHNVGNALRACAVLGAAELLWTGNRVRHPDRWGPGERLPREERLRDYRSVVLTHAEEDALSRLGATPVCVEVSDNAESLPDFVHPDDAVYVSGPEDGGVPKGVRTVCHRFVCIPGTKRTPLNLAAAVNIVLYDRISKQLRDHGSIIDDRAEAVRS